MPVSPCSLSQPLLNTSASTASITSSEPDDRQPSLAALLERLPFHGSSDRERDIGATEAPRGRWAAWWPRRRPPMAYLPPPPSPTRSASPVAPPLISPFASEFEASFPPEAGALAPPAAALPRSVPSRVPGSDLAPTVSQASQAWHGPGHTLGVLIGVLGCGMLGAVFGMQYAGRLANGYEIAAGGMAGDDRAQISAAWLYLPALLFFGAKAACFGWAVAQLHRLEGWDAPSLWSATTRNIAQHPNPELRQRLHRRMALGVTVGVAQAAFCGWHYATLHNGGWRMAVFPYLLPVIDLPATWAATRCLFVPLADACGPATHPCVDPELGSL